MQIQIIILLAIVAASVCDVVYAETESNAKNPVVIEHIDNDEHLKVAENNHYLPSQDEHTHHGGQIHLVSWRWKDYGRILIFTFIMVLAGSIKLLFHHTPVLSEHMPESCVLIVSGIIIGSFVYAKSLNDHTQHDEIHQYFPSFTSSIFFLVLLPPIILDSAYSIYNRHFLDNLGGIIVFAVLGTLLNAFCIGYALYFINKLGWMGELPEDLSPIASLKFAALISAVDPVAVLAIFQEIGVNISLYFMVFGESLLNDGVSIVLYNSMGSLASIAGSTEEGSIAEINYLFAILSFFTVVFGGLLVGLCIGAISSIIVKYTQHTEVIEPFLILAMSYFSYVLAETLHWSGILSLIGCGIAQKRYAFLNISKTSLSTIKHAVTTLATFADCVIFLFLGIVTVSRPNDLYWHWGFSLWTCLLCLIIRFIGVFFLSAILNLRRFHKISIQEQIIIGYGGLRGAVGFSLAVILFQEDGGELSKIFLTTTLFMVYFTVFLQGGTIKLLVEKLHIEKEQEHVRMISDDVHSKTLDLTMAGIGAVVGRIHYNELLEAIEIFDIKHIKKWLVRDNVVDKMTEHFNQISIEEHYTRLYGPNALSSEKKLSGIAEEPTTINKVATISPSIKVEMIYNNDSTDASPTNAPFVKVSLPSENLDADVKIDKDIIKQAFSHSAYEKRRRSQYDVRVGCVKTRHNSDGHLQNVLKEYKEKTKAIKTSAIKRSIFHKK